MSYCPRTLVAIPAYNEEECIENTIIELRQVAPKFDYVVINDGSHDRTLSICENIGCNIINMPINCGLTVGFQTAARYAVDHGYDYMIQFDADGQHRPEYLAALVGKAVNTGSDIVIGSRFLTVRKDKSMRMVGSRMITVLIKMLTGHRISDPTSGFRACNKDAIDLFCKSYPDDYPEPESIALAMKLGLPVMEAPVKMNERQGGRSSIGVLSSVYYMIKVTLAIVLVCWVHRGDQ